MCPESFLIQLTQPKSFWLYLQSTLSIWPLLTHLHQSTLWSKPLDFYKSLPTAHPPFPHLLSCSNRWLQMSLLSANLSKSLLSHWAKPKVLTGTSRTMRCNPQTPPPYHLHHPLSLPQSPRRVPKPPRHQALFPLPRMLFSGYPRGCILTSFRPLPPCHLLSKTFPRHPFKLHVLPLTHLTTYHPFLVFFFLHSTYKHLTYWILRCLLCLPLLQWKPHEGRILACFVHCSYFPRLKKAKSTFKYLLNV